MYFVHPHYLWLLLLIPIAYGIRSIFYKKQPAIIYPWITEIPVKNKLFHGKRIQKILVCSIVMLSIITLARPQIPDEHKTLNKEGVDIMLAVDISLSMLAEDLSPNRMEASKTHLTDFIDNIDEDRIGLTIFSGKAITISPLTFDYDVIKTFLAKLSPFMLEQHYVGVSGTNISDALLLSAERLQDEERTRVIILLTDGDANTGIAPVPVAKEIARQGIKLYVIGIGQDRGIRIPIRNEKGEQIYIQNPDGTPVYAQFNEKSLQAIAHGGNGKYFRVSDNSGLEEVLDTINQLEKTELSIQTFTEYKDVFIPLLWSICILMVALGIWNVKYPNI